MTVLAIGPRAASPSWDWVGLGMAGGLARYFDVVLFDGLERPPDADLVLVVKQRPSDRRLPEPGRHRCGCRHAARL
jgi:hypothetical protein